MDKSSDNSIRLEAAPQNALVFRVVDAKTGRVLSQEEAQARVAVAAAPEPRTAAAAAIRLCGEGDSWINLLSDLSGFPKTFFDVLGQTFPTRNIAFPGDTFEEILARKQYKQLLQSGRFRVFVFSGGGNDILGGGGLSALLKKKEDGHGSTDPADYLKKAAVNNVMSKLEDGYRLVAKEARIFEPSITMLTHGYDYAIPRKNGRWLGKPFAEKGYAHDDPIAPAIIVHLVDRFNEVLKAVDEDNAHVRHVDVRGTIKTRWHDELHPKATGAVAVAKLFAKEIGRLLVA
jgi:lysophospholipase L1-like esterase